MIISELHGKVYYVITKNHAEMMRFQMLLLEEEALKDEKFYFTKHPTGSWIILSEARCGDFRGEKMIAWSRAKRKFYKLRKEDSE